MEQMDFVTPAKPKAKITIPDRKPAVAKRKAELAMRLAQRLLVLGDVGQPFHCRAGVVDVPGHALSQCPAALRRQARQKFLAHFRLGAGGLQHRRIVVEREQLLDALGFRELLLCQILLAQRFGARP